MLKRSEVLEGVSILELSASSCRWPLWSDLPIMASEARYCGNETEEGKTLCAFHREMGTGPGTESERTAHKIGKRHLL